MEEAVYTPDTINQIPKHESLLPPIIANFPSGKIAVFTNGGGNYKVSDDVTLEHIHSRWIKWKSKSQEKLNIPGDVKTWNIESSKPGNFYEVKYQNKSFSCTCPGFGFRRKCRHITEVQNTLK